MKNFWLTKAETKKSSNNLSTEELFQKMFGERCQHYWNFSKTTRFKKFKVNNDEVFWFTVKPITKNGKLTSL